MGEAKEGTLEPLFVGDHAVMDMLNTVARPVGEIVDFWRTDKDVLEWLQRTGSLENSAKLEFRSGALLTAAWHLREVVRTLVSRRKAGKRLDLKPLNELLERVRSHAVLINAKAGTMVLEKIYERRTPQEILGALTEASAGFLATADFERVRACEGEGCVLWFYDQSKSRRRRWCSMETCGNRHKVEAFRARAAQ